MITIEKTSNAIKFTFDDNGHYLQNGTIEVPINSLSMIMDESDMVTFKKSATNDIFVSARYDDFGMTKAELEAFYKENMVGSVGSGSGASITIDDNLDSGSTNAVTNAAITNAVISNDGEIYTSYTNKNQYFYTDKQDFKNNEFTYALILPFVGINTFHYVSFIMVGDDVSSIYIDMNNGVITSFSTTNFDTYFTAELINNTIKIYSKGIADIKQVTTYGDIELRFYYRLSGGTPSDVIENSVYGELQDIKNDIDNLYNSAPISEDYTFVRDSYVEDKYYRIGRSGLTSGHTEIPLGNGILGYYGSLGVFASGETKEYRENTPSKTKNLTFVGYNAMKPTKKVLIQPNRDYTGNNNTFSLYVHSKNGDTYLVNFTYVKYLNSFEIYNPDLIPITWNYDGLFITVETTAEYFESIYTDGYIAGTNNPYDDSFIHSVYSQRNTFTLQEALDNKQNALVSGTNIKTINNESILGSGNINNSVSAHTFIVGGTFGKVDKTVRVFEDFNVNKLELSFVTTRTATDAKVLWLWYLWNNQYYTSGNLYITSSKRYGILDYRWEPNNPNLQESIPTFEVVDGKLIISLGANSQLSDYGWGTNNTANYMKLGYIKELASGDTASVVENEKEILDIALRYIPQVESNTYAVNNTIAVSEPRINIETNSIDFFYTPIYLNGETTTSGSITTSSYSFDDTIMFKDNKLGVYVKGQNKEEVITDYINANTVFYLNYLDTPPIGVAFSKNPNFHLTLSAPLSVNVRVGGVDTTYTWNYDFTNNAFVTSDTIPSSLTFTYDKSSGNIRIITSEGFLSRITCNDMFCGTSNPSNPMCGYGVISSITNQYKLQDAIDEIEEVSARALNELSTNMGGLKLVKLTQNQYDAIVNKDENTIYFIKD